MYGPEDRRAKVTSLANKVFWLETGLYQSADIWVLKQQSCDTPIRVNLSAQYW